jgi:hypothetical protein
MNATRSLLTNLVASVVNSFVSIEIFDGTKLSMTQIECKYCARSFAHRNCLREVHVKKLHHMRYLRAALYLRSHCEAAMTWDVRVSLDTYLQANDATKKLQRIARSMTEFWDRSMRQRVGDPGLASAKSPKAWSPRYSGEVRFPMIVLDSF